MIYVICVELKNGEQHEGEHADTPRRARNVVHAICSEAAADEGPLFVDIGADAHIRATEIAAVWFEERES